MTALGHLGLGSNVGEREAHLQFAVHALGAHGVRVRRSAALYETEPVGEVLDQRPFLNTVVEVETDLDPLGLLDACKAVEAERGRVLEGEPGYVRHGPRPLDVDVLLLDPPGTFASDRLTLPHRETRSRRFVLVPLLELVPDLPGAAADLAAIEGQDVRRAGPPLRIG